MRLLQVRRWLWLARRWFITGWAPGVEPSAEDEAAFYADWRSSNARDAVIVILVLMAFDLGYWPTDDWVLPGQHETVRVIREARLGEASLGLVALLALWLAPARAILIVSVGGLTGLVLLGWSFARCGGPSSPWLYFSFPYFFGTAAGWLRPWHRALLLLTLGGALAASYFGARPEYIYDPMTRVAFGHFVYILFAAFLAGSWFDTFRVRLFLATRRLAEEHAALSDRVAEQTQSLRLLVRRTETIREAERTAIARDLHDDLGQTITAARLILKHARTRPDPSMIGANLDMLAQGLDQMHAQTRRILQALRPTLLEDDGIENAVSALVQRTAESSGLDVRYTPQPLDLPDEVAAAALRCVQEALTNVVRHADATRVDVALQVVDGVLRISVSDDGCGFDPAASTAGLGLLGLRERAAIFGGTAEFVSAPGRGCHVVLRIPALESS